MCSSRTRGTLLAGQGAYVFSKSVTINWTLAQKDSNKSQTWLNATYANVDCSGERLTCVPKSSGFWNTFWYNYNIVVKTCNIPWGTPYSWAHGMPQWILQVCIIILYENVFQNPELFGTQVSLSPKQSTLCEGQILKCFLFSFHFVYINIYFLLNSQ
jgi:hypothetical protein